MEKNYLTKILYLQLTLTYFLGTTLSEQWKSTWYLRVWIYTIKWLLNLQHRIVRFVFLKGYFNISAENEQKVDKDGNKKIDSQSITIVSGQRNLVYS